MWGNTSTKAKDQGTCKIWHTLCLNLQNSHHFHPNTLSVSKWVLPLWCKHIKGIGIYSTSWSQKHITQVLPYWSSINTMMVPVFPLCSWETQIYWHLHWPQPPEWCPWKSSSETHLKVRTGLFKPPGIHTKCVLWYASFLSSQFNTPLILYLCIGVHH